jgi:hypothetical protein
MQQLDDGIEYLAQVSLGAEFEIRGIRREISG